MTVCNKTSILLKTEKPKVTKDLFPFSKLVTGPYFRLVGELKSIFELNPFLAQLQEALQKLAKDSSPLMEGKPIFDEEIVKIKKDVVYERLMSDVHSDEFQVLTQQILEIICATILIVLERQCADQLPGGKYHDYHLCFRWCLFKFLHHELEPYLGQAVVLCSLKKEIKDNVTLW